MAEKALVYIGTYTEPILFGTGKVLMGKGKGIYVCEMDLQSGRMRLVGVKEQVVNPSYIAFGHNGNHIYAVNELKTYNGQASGTVSAFRLGQQPSDMEFLGLRLTMGTDPCHVAIDRSGKFLAVANFRTGSVAIFPILSDGSLGERTAFVQHTGSSIDPKRQTGPHAHSIIFDPSNRYLLVPDLGIDKVVVYEFDSATGSIASSQKRSVSVTAGSGPRYLEYHPSGAFAYLINELNSTVTAFTVDQEGLLSEIQNIRTLPEGYEGESTCADLHIAPSGQYLYASNRGHDSLAMFAINAQTGMLTAIGHISTHGRIPRNFVIDPSGRFVLVANQDSDNIAVFEIDSRNGLLAYTGIEVEVPTPVCVRFLPF